MDTVTIKPTAKNITSGYLRAINLLHPGREC